MDNFKIIYKILRELEKNMGNEEFSVQSISAGKLKIPYNQWEQLMILMQDEGYINAGRIKSMTDEELAEYLLFFVPTVLERAMHTGISGKYTETAEETIKNNLDWLKRPAENEG